MANLREWLLENLISGVKKRIFAKEYASILATNYLLRGMLTQDDIQAFIEATKEPEPAKEENSAETEETAENAVEDTEDNAEEAE